MLEQAREQVELFRGERDRPFAHRHLVRAAPERDLSECEDLLGRAVADAPKDRPDPRHELARRERLRHVIVGADLETADPVRLLVTGGQHQDGNVRARSDPPAHLEAVHRREPDVQHDDPNRVPGERDQRLLAGRGPDDLVAVALHVRPDQLADAVLVLDEKDGSGGGWLGRRNPRPRVRHAPYLDVTAVIRFAGASPSRSASMCALRGIEASDTGTPSSSTRAPAATAMVTRRP